jgi:hypothetical protein
MFIIWWSGEKLTAKHLFRRFYLQSKKPYAILNASGAAALTGRRNVRGLSKADCRGRRETYSHRYTMNDVETGEYKLTFRTVKLKLLTEPFRLGHLLYLETVIKSIFNW